jgi:hypothetical protein
VSANHQFIPTKYDKTRSPGVSVTGVCLNQTIRSSWQSGLHFVFERYLIQTSEGFRPFSRFLLLNAGTINTFSHDRFLPHFFEFIIGCPSRSSARKEQCMVWPCLSTAIVGLYYWATMRSNNSYCSQHGRAKIPMAFLEDTVGQTERLGGVINALASYSCGPGFKSRPGGWLSWLRVSWFSSIALGKFRDGYLKLSHDRFLPRPFQFFIHSSPLHSTLYNFWESVVKQSTNKNKMPLV